MCSWVFLGGTWVTLGVVGLRGGWVFTAVLVELGFLGVGWVRGLVLRWVVGWANCLRIFGWWVWFVSWGYCCFLWLLVCDFVGWFACGWWFGIWWLLVYYCVMFTLFADRLGASRFACFAYFLVTCLVWRVWGGLFPVFVWVLIGFDLGILCVL